MRRKHYDAVNQSATQKAKSSFAAPSCYTAGEFVWFLKSMRMMKFVCVDSGGKTCTLERLEDGRHLVAVYPSGIKPCNDPSSTTGADNPNL